MKIISFSTYIVIVLVGSPLIGPNIMKVLELVGYHKFVKLFLKRKYSFVPWYYKHKGPKQCFC